MESVGREHAFKTYYHMGRTESGDSHTIINAWGRA
jgi:hypothetical protein